MKKRKRFVAEPNKGISWGLQFEYMFRLEVPDSGPEWVVYKRNTGEVVAVYTEARHGKYFAEHYASKRSLRLNGNPGVDMEGIDSTP